MKTKFRQIYFVLIFICSGNFCLAVVGPTSSFKEMSPVEKSEQFRKLNSNRKLSFKERIVLKILKRKIKKKKSKKKKNKNSKKLSWVALTGFVLGLLSLVTPGLGIFGLIFSLVALKRFKTDTYDRRGKNLAELGMILSIVGIVITFLVLLLALAFLGI